MKVTSIEIRPDNSPEIIELSFRDPLRENSFNVKGITGLDADEITPRYVGMSTSSTSSLFEMALNKREIVLKIEINPQYANKESFASLRDRLYRTVFTSRTGKVQLRFKNLSVYVAELSGFITKFEVAYFDQVPELQMTVKCDEPMLKGPTPIDVLVRDIDLAEFVIDDSISTAPHGFAFEIELTDVLVDTIDISDPDDDSWKFIISPGWGWLAGDKVSFSTDFKNKQLFLIRSGVSYYLADIIAAGSAWPLIFPGANKFSFTNADVLQINSMSFYPAYWGV